MKYFFYITFLVSLLSACTPKTEEAPTNLVVTWYFPVYYQEKYDNRYDSSSLIKLPWRLLDAIDEGKIKTYDSALHEVSRAELESRITKNMCSLILTQEECDIMLANGDTSVGQYFYPKQTAKDLQRLFAQHKNIDSLLLRRPPFESKVFQLELVEKVTLDTTLRSQRGTMQYIRLITPKEFTKSGHDEIFCQVKYEDFKTLGMTEQKIIDDHTFLIYADDAELTIDDGKSIQRLSSLKQTKTEEGIQHEQIKKTVFKYFAKNLIVMKYDENSKDALIMEVDY